MANASLRWGRIVLGGFLAEILLILAVIPVYATGGNQTIITTVAVAGSFLAFIPVAWWLARTTSSPVLHGTLMGAAGAAIYILLTVVGRQFDPNAPPAPWIYYVGHALKLAGGATGGWLAKGRRLRNQESVVRTP